MEYGNYTPLVNSIRTMTYKIIIKKLVTRCRYYLQHFIVKIAYVLKRIQRCIDHLILLSKLLISFAHFMA